MKVKWKVVSGVSLVVVAACAVAVVAEERKQAPVLGQLTTMGQVNTSQVFQVGTFRIRWNATSRQLTVTQSDAPNHVVYATPPGQAFVEAERVNTTSSEKIGYFTLKSSILEKDTDQTITSMRMESGGLLIQGTVGPRGRDAKQGHPYTLTLSATNATQLSYHLVVAGNGSTSAISSASAAVANQADSPVNRVFLNWQTRPSEHFYGFGTQFSDFDMKGKKVPILVEEHGDGRGMQPLTFLANLTHGAGGHWYNTYAPVPHFLSSTMQSLYSENTQPQAFNFRNPRVGQLQVDSADAKGIVFAGTTPAQLVNAYTSVTGRMQPLPAWTQQGLLFGAEGGTQVVTQHLNQILDANVPVTGLWIQDWVGERKTSFGTQLQWNWQLNPNQYPNWPHFTSYLQQQNIRLLGYINPFLANTPDVPGVTNLYQIAKQKGYFVKGSDGQPIQFQYPNFKASLIDLTNPQAKAWLEQVMEQQLVANGFSGWMADFGEELPLNVTLANGQTGWTLHNEYPVLWAQVNKEVMQQSGLGSSGLFFMRSGFSTSPATTSDFWLGDQLESWDKGNGLASAVTGLLSSGLSGYSMESSDIGGYTSLTQFPLHYVRTPEMLERWMELDAFTTLFRSHEGNQPQKNTQVYSSPAVIQQLRRFSIVFRDLAPYRETLMQQAAKTGDPVDRPLFYQYPKDPEAYKVGTSEFMMGPDVLVAPVTKKGVTSMRVYLPAGKWVHVWDGKTFDETSGAYVNVAAPIGEPPVFVRAGSAVEKQFEQALHDIG